MDQKFLSPRFFFWVTLTLLTFLGSCKSKKKLAEESPAFTVIQTAKSYRGTPYRYGGTTKAGIDCSALVYHSFYSIGISLPRRSEDQSKLGEKVPLTQVKPGDVLFFATGRKRNEVSHSGIVTEVEKGDVRFIHSSTSLGVTEDFLSSEYWSKAFLFAKRILE
ncbi:C40 family peptidase [Algoriphagus aquatilis]|uniref:C40 family peptidase n=1 Tax=Algoriphagus aquatilis TaxID=490186 RepID=A0ABW0BZA6_9BACT|nr:C40 family peptidase [Algoriphagus sp.]